MLNNLCALRLFWSDAVQMRNHRIKVVEVNVQRLVSLVALLGIANVGRLYLQYESGDKLYNLLVQLYVHLNLIRLIDNLYLDLLKLRIKNQAVVNFFKVVLKLQ